MDEQTRITPEAEQSEWAIERPWPASALDPRVDVEKLEPMIAMHEGLKAKEAELAFNAAS